MRARWGLALFWMLAAWGQRAATPLFDGKTLNGWVGDTPGLWQVRDGMIVGRHEEFRLVNGEGNTGVPFRSQPLPDTHEAAGYQAEIGMQHWGCRYDKSRRKRVLAQAAAGSLDALDKTGWNEYMITARGSHIMPTLNGKRTVDDTEPEPGMDSQAFLRCWCTAGRGLRFGARISSCGSCAKPGRVKIEN